MHIVAIAWIYVVLMMAITEHSIVAAIMTFLLYGVLPLAIILYIGGSRKRRRRRALAQKTGSAATVRGASEDHPSAQDRKSD